MQANNIISIPGNELDFYQAIEDSVIAANLSYIDAITDWAEKRDVEIENIVGFIKKNQMLKNKIQTEAEQLKLLKKTIRLPL
jgi:hypothetical protein